MRHSTRGWEEDERSISRIVARLVINAIAVWIASHLIRGITPLDQVSSILLVALIFGLVNALIKPVFQLLTCPVQILTLGLFTLVVNAAMLGLTAWLARLFIVPFAVDGFIAALLGALVMSVVSWALSSFV